MRAGNRFSLAFATMLAVVLSDGEPASAQDPEYRTILRFWDGQRYDSAFDRLVRYRASPTPYVRNEVVDYLIATSACRTNRASLGQALFDAMLYHYSLDEPSRRLVQNERRRCPPTASARPVLLATNGAGSATSGTRGKMYYAVRGSGSSELPLANQPVTVLRKIEESEFANRLFSLEQRPPAIAKVAALAGTGYRVRSYGPFVLASRTHSEASLQRIAGGLAAYVDFFVREFGMARPEQLLTIYLADSKARMSALAARVHGIKVNELSIGYSFRNDLSMVAIVPAEVYGTLAHELFHLLVRREFGDVPPWLDEGFAALYEVSRVRADGQVEGLHNWRGRVLEFMGPNFVPLADLLSADWNRFDAQGHDVDRQATNYAKARYFALYLQERGELAKVYRSFRERDVLALKELPGTDAVHRIEQLLGAPIAAIDADFMAWFRKLPPAPR
ncbi:MAG TPA: hypothetical protein VK864_12060 [Longimicrobiales bacterium]|nr:hypothetical protein [Longimicrobiales bacterium]